MGFITQVLFESPIRLGVFSFLLFAVVLLTRMRWESETARRYALPGIILLIVLLFVTQKLVVTRREEVLRTLEHFLTAIEQENLPTTTGFISPDFQTREMDDDDLAAWLESFFEAWTIRDARVHRSEVNFSNDTAKMTFSASATAIRQGTTGEWHRGSWRIDWVREAGEWKILSIQTVAIDGISVETIPDIPGRIP